MSIKLIVLIVVCGVWSIVRYVQNLVNDKFDFGDYEIIGDLPCWIFYPIATILDFLRSAILPIVCFGVVYFIWG